LFILESIDMLFSKFEVIEVKKDKARWGKMQENIDMLFSKFEAQDETQHQMVAQLDIMAKALTQSL
jgi:hypothetical protein